MTMKRTDKLNHGMQLKVAGQNSGYVAEEFASPKLRAAALAETGHMMMPAGDYVALRMGRGVQALWLAREYYTTARRYRRRPVRR